MNECLYVWMYTYTNRLYIYCTNVNQLRLQTYLYCFVYTQHRYGKGIREKESKRWWNTASQTKRRGKKRRRGGESIRQTNWPPFLAKMTIFTVPCENDCSRRPWVAIIPSVTMCTKWDSPYRFSAEKGTNSVPKTKPHVTDKTFTAVWRAVIDSWMFSWVMSSRWLFQKTF